MTDGQAHLAKARASLEFSKFVLASGYVEEAGRSASMSAFHAATAFIEHKTGKSPKTHRGVRSEFGRLARGDSRLSQAHVALLGWTYELKNAADYDRVAEVATTNVKRAIAEAADLLLLIEQVLETPAAGTFDAG